MNYCQNHELPEPPPGLGVRQSSAALEWNLAILGKAKNFSHHSPSWKSGRGLPHSKTLHGQPRHNLLMAYLAAVALLLVSIAARADDTGFGPPISVPHDLPPTTLQPKTRNRI